MRQEVNRILRELAEQRLGALGQRRVCAAGDFSEQFAGAFFVTDFTTGNRKIKLGLESGEVRVVTLRPALKLSVGSTSPLTLVLSVPVTYTSATRSIWVRVK